MTRIGRLRCCPFLESSLKSVENGNPDQVVGVYVVGLMALPVVQQPYGSPAYVSEQPEVATQFGNGDRNTIQWD